MASLGEGGERGLIAPGDTLRGWHPKEKLWNRGDTAELTADTQRWQKRSSVFSGNNRCDSRQLPPRVTLTVLTPLGHYAHSHHMADTECPASTILTLVRALVIIKVDYCCVGLWLCSGQAVLSAQRRPSTRVLTHQPSSPTHSLIAGSEAHPVLPVRPAVHTVSSFLTDSRSTVS